MELIENFVMNFLFLCHAHIAERIVKKDLRIYETEKYKIIDKYCVFEGQRDLLV